jgi:hypothetical protein
MRRQIVVGKFAGGLKIQFARYQMMKLKKFVKGFESFSEWRSSINLRLLDSGQFMAIRCEDGIKHGFDV